MYTPKHFKVSDFEEIREFVQANSFGTLVTTKNGQPVATHLPMQLANEKNAFYVTGHMAYGNPQWKTFEINENVLVIFQGPHAYVSSSWYEKENVPTWNYQAVHLYGTPTLLNEDELKQDLGKLMNKYEKHREDPVVLENLSPSLVEKELKGIVGFKIEVKEVQAAYKLSQNRTETDYRNIIEHLKNEEDPEANQMAELMKKRLE